MGAIRSGGTANKIQPAGDYLSVYGPASNASGLLGAGLGYCVWNLAVVRGLVLEIASRTPMVESQHARPTERLQAEVTFAMGRRAHAGLVRISERLDAERFSRSCCHPGFQANRGATISLSTLP